MNTHITIAIILFILGILFEVGSMSVSLLLTNKSRAISEAKKFHYMALILVITGIGAMLYRPN